MSSVGVPVRFVDIPTWSYELSAKSGGGNVKYAFHMVNRFLVAGLSFNSPELIAGMLVSRKTATIVKVGVFNSF